MDDTDFNNLVFHSGDQEEDDTDAQLYDNPPSPNAKSGDKNCCTNKCLLRFDDEFKTLFKTKMSQMDRFSKNVYMFAMITIDSSKINAKKIIKSSKCFHYAVKDQGANYPVCKSAFITMHVTTVTLVRTLCIKMATGCIIPTDNRGKHNNRSIITDKIKVAIQKHFFSILESPDIFKCAKKPLGQPNIAQLWTSFKQEHGHISRSTYTKYIQLLLTPEVESKFMCANKAQQIFQYINKNKSS